MSFEAYKIAVKLSLVNNVSAGLMALSTHFVGLNKHIGGANAGLAALEARLSNIKRLGLVGGAAAGLGFGALAMLKGPIEEAKKFQSEQARFAALGLGDQALADATKFAKGMNIIGSSARDNLKLLREATTITGDLSHAEAIAPMLAKMRFGIRAVMGEEHAGSFEKQFADAIKVTELRGALVNRQTGEIDPGAFGNVLNKMTQAYVASGGLVKPSDYLAAIKTGGVSAKLMNDESFFFGLGHFMQESGGTRTGTAMMSQFQNWVMGRMSQRVAEDMSKLGLLQPGAIHYGKTGHITRVDAQGLLRSQEFVDNPFKYMNDVVVPLLKQRGYSGNDLNLKLASLFGIRTASNLADQFVREQKIADNYISRSRKAADVEGLYQVGGGTLAGKQIDLSAKWRDVLRELGTVVLPIAIRAVVGLTSVLKAATQFAKDFPLLTRAIVLTGAALAVLVGVGGTLMLATAGFRAMGLALSVLTLGGGGGMLAATAGGLLKVGTAIRGLVSAQGVMALASGLGGLGVKIASLIGPGSVLAAAGLVGYGVGTVVHKAIEGTSLDNAIGYGVARVAAFFGSENAREAVRIDSGGALYGSAWERGRAHMYGDTVRSKQSQPVQVTSVVKINEREIGRAVTKHQEQAVARPQGGSSWFDGGIMPPPVNSAY